MQKIWQQAKRIIIFLSLWAIVTALTASAVLHYLIILPVMSKERCLKI